MKLALQPNEAGGGDLLGAGVRPEAEGGVQRFDSLADARFLLPPGHPHKDAAEQFATVAEEIADEAVKPRRIG
ncbi:MAG: hypothetical protein EBR07_07945, partial [Planctomycetes bacterium]|nr:hypothetical protein [Planctomycetota bacterium]